MIINDILGYWQLDKSYRFYSGQIIVQQNGWFEGVMRLTSFSHDIQDDMGFVFGIYHEKKVIDLFYCSSNDILRLYCDFQNNNHNSNLYRVELITQEEIKMVNSSFTVRQNNSDTLNEIKFKTGIEKSQIYRNGMELYQKFYAIQDRYTEAVLKSYWNLKYQKIDISILLDSYQKNQNAKEIVGANYQKYLEKKYCCNKLGPNLIKVNKLK